MTTPKTVRVRVAVGVDARGVWSAIGDCSFPDDDMAARLFMEDSRITFIEADVPLPEKPETVEAEGME